MALPATYLFVPADRPERYAKAFDAGADAVIVDLEDAVAPGAKDAAREAFIDWCRARADVPSNLLLRINDVASPAFEADLAAVRATGVHGVMLPKAESMEAVARVRQALRPEGYVVALVETARGVRDIDALVTAPGLQRIAFGTIDYALDLGASDDERGLVYPSSRIAIASRVAGLGSPIAGVTLAIDDEERLLADLAFARAFGFGAKLCIHPRQVAVLRRALIPSAKQVKWARRVLDAVKQGGAVQVDGKMVDRPVIRQAEDILDRHERLSPGAAGSP